MSGINVSYRGEGPNVTTGNGGGAAPADVPQRKPNDASGGIGDSRAAAGDRIGRLMVDTGPVRSSVAINVSSADQILTQCTRWVYVGTTGNLVCRCADDAADQTFSNLAVGWHQLAVAIVRKTGTTIAGNLCF